MVAKQALVALATRTFDPASVDRTATNPARLARIPGDAIAAVTTIASRITARIAATATALGVATTTSAAVTRFGAARPPSRALAAATTGEYARGEESERTPASDPTIACHDSMLHHAAEDLQASVTPALLMCWINPQGGTVSIQLGRESELADRFNLCENRTAKALKGEGKMANHQDTERIRGSIERVSRWMNAHGAPLLVSNLAPGASVGELARAEAELGLVLPSDLAALWSLHDGQREEGNGFIESYDLLSIQGALDQRESVLSGIAFARESPDWWKDSGGTSEELDSNHWFPFAGRDSDSIVVHGVTGRVFYCPHDDSPKLVAPSLGEWFQRYADRVEADDYSVEEGIGDYYLELRDREAERREQERARRAAEHERMRRETPLLEQLRQAIEAKNADRCTEVLKDALDRKENETFDAAVALLFADDLDVKLVAGALRPVLNAVTLTGDQWVDVAVGGALLGNNAIRDVAVLRAVGVSAARQKRLETAIAGASPDERGSLEAVLQKLRAKQPSEAPADGNAGGWWSRLFKKGSPQG